MKDVFHIHLNKGTMRNQIKTHNGQSKKPLMRIIFFCAIAFLLLSRSSVLAQSAVYVYKNTETGKSDYMFVYGMANAEEAEKWAISKFEELNYDKAQIKRYASTNDKGHGVIIRALYKSDSGLLLTAYGAALGAISYEEAEEKAVENLIANNPDLPTSNNYRIIQKFWDEAEPY